VFLRVVREVIVPFWYLVVAGIALMGLTTAINLAPPWLMKMLIDDVFTQGNLPMLNLVVLATVLVYITRALISFTQNITNNLLGQNITRLMRKRVYNHLLTMENQFFENEQVGRIVSRVMGDVDAVEHLITGGVEQLIVSAMTLIGIAAILFRINWQLALFSLIPIPFLVLVMTGFGSKVRLVYRSVREKAAEVTGKLADSVAGITVVKSFAREPEEQSWFARQLDEYFKMNMEATVLWVSYFPMISFITGIGSVMILWLGGQQIIGGVLTIGELVAFNSYLGQFYSPVMQISRLSVQLQRSLASVDRVFELIDREPKIKDAPNAQEKSHIEGRIEFRNVHFSYEPGQPVLHGISFVANPGEMIALVGPSGSGKSTITNLIPRFYDVDQGSILVDGLDVRQWKLASLRSHIGMVLQDTFLFNGTARENLRYGRLDATDEEIIEAAKAARIHEFLASLPQGYDTQLGERGVKLSGGQRQRLSIARTILKDPKILILDEATSSVDSEVESLIQEALEELMKNRTTIVIAHRLSTIKNADRIIAIKDGRIVEEGSHDELMAKKGLYAYLYELQFQLQDEAEDKDKRRPDRRPGRDRRRRDQQPADDRMPSLPGPMEFDLPNVP
jgi:ABC-type multidrug transport system fused ATPase/permease subunit